MEAWLPKELDVFLDLLQASQVNLLVTIYLIAVKISSGEAPLNHLQKLALDRGETPVVVLVRRLLGLLHDVHVKLRMKRVQSVSVFFCDLSMALYLRSLCDPMETPCLKSWLFCLLVLMELGTDT